MPINVICPHCESRLNLQEDLLGKPMRCPICRDIFTVAVATPLVPEPIEAVPEPKSEPKAKVGVPRADAPAPNYQSGSITDFIELLPVEPSAQVAPSVEPKEIVWSESPAPDQTLLVPAASEVKEIVWSADGEATEGSLPGPADEGTDDANPIQPEARIAPRRKRSRVALLAFLITVVIGGIGAGGYWLKKHNDAAPDRLIARAQQEYDKKNYEPARAAFDQFAKEYPDDPRLRRRGSLSNCPPFERRSVRSRSSQTLYRLKNNSKNFLRRSSGRP